MAYLDYPGLSYFKSLLDETYLRISYTDGTAVIADDIIFEGNATFDDGATFTKSITVNSGDPQHPVYIFGNLDGKAKKDWRDQQIDSTYIKSISTNDNVGQIVYTKGDNTSNYIMIDMMQGATASAAGKAGLVPAPTISERTKFLRGDGEWGVPTDIYVTQNLISTNDSFPILIGATAGATESQIGTAIAFGTKVSVNPNTHTLIADHLILKHPTYRRSNNVTSKIMNTLNFADSDDGNGNNLGEVFWYVDPISDGGEHELGFRLFGNPNIQGVIEKNPYVSVGLSLTNIPYGHAPETPVPADHNEDTDIITRSYLKLNGSITGLVHTTMPETISGIKTFTDETRNTSTAGITTTKLTASGKITGTGTAEISGGSGNTPSLKVTGNETVTGDLSVGGNETVTGNMSTTNGNISTTNGTVSGKTGSIGTGGLTVTGPSNLNGKVTAGNGLDITGNETVSGNLTVDGTTTTEDLTVTDDATVGDDLIVNGDSLIKGNETVKGDETVEGDIIVKGSIFKTSKDGDEYVTYITNQQDVRETIINNLIKNNGGLAQDSNKNIYVKTGDGIQVSNGYVTTKLTTNGGLAYAGSTANAKSLSVNVGAGLKIDTSGKINVEFEDLDPDEVGKIVRGMIPISDGKYVGGLAAIDDENDPNNGKLIVDFSQMPPDKFDTLKASLGMQRQVTSSTRVFYVDYDNLNASDIIRNTVNGVSQFDFTRGLSLDKPFKTVNGAVKAITENYSLGTNNVTVYIVPREARSATDLTAISSSTTLNSSNKTRIAKLFNIAATDDDADAITSALTESQQNKVISNLTTYPYYRESVSLPDYTATSGRIIICGYIATGKTQNNSGVSAENPMPMPKILTSSTCGYVVNVSGKYTLRYLELHNRVRDPGTSEAVFPSVIACGENNQVTLYGIHEYFNFYGTRGKVGIFEITGVNTAPTTIKISNSTNPTAYVDVVENSEFLGYAYLGYNPSNNTENERERPMLDVTNGIVTILSYNYDSENNKVILKYTFSDTDGKAIATNTDNPTESSCNIKIDNGNNITKTIANNSLDSANNIQMRMNTTVGGRIILSILDKCNTLFSYNTDPKAISTRTGTKPIATNNFNHLVVIRAERSGSIENASSATIKRPYTLIYCEGNAVNFLELTSFSRYTQVTGQRYHMNYINSYNKTCTGTPFVISSGSGASVPAPIKWNVTNNGWSVNSSGIVTWNNLDIWAIDSTNTGHAFPSTVAADGVTEKIGQVDGVDWGTIPIDNTYAWYSESTSITS